MVDTTTRRVNVYPGAMAGQVLHPGRGKRSKRSAFPVESSKFVLPGAPFESGAYPRRVGPSSFSVGKSQSWPLRSPMPVRSEPPHSTDAPAPGARSEAPFPTTSDRPDPCAPADRFRSSRASLQPSHPSREIHAAPLLLQDFASPAAGRPSKLHHGAQMPGQRLAKPARRLLSGRRSWAS
jgi:hypothetical protein